MRLPHCSAARSRSERLAFANNLATTVLGPDTKNQTLTDYYGLTGAKFDYSNAQIAQNPVITGNAFDATVDSVIVANNTSTVPDNGSAMALLGMALVGLGTLRRRMGL